MGIRQPTFLPPMGRMMAPAAGVAALGAAPAFADEIGDAAKKLAEASYPFAKGVDWNNGIYLQAPGAFKPLEAIKAIDKMIVMGAQADPKLLKAAADAHHKAIGSISGCECGARPCDCVCARVLSHGRLQLRFLHHRLRCSRIPEVLGERGRR